MDLKLTDKVAVITGTGSQIGMGKAVSLALAKEGCHIVSADLDFEGAQKTAAEVKALGRRAIAAKVDVANRGDVDKMVEATLKEFGKIDILVNAAGLTSAPATRFMQLKRENWEKDIAVNFYGTMNTIQAIIPHMVERHYGKIINFSSQAATMGVATSYACAKGAVMVFTRGLANEYGGSGINVNAVAPTGVPGTNFAGGPSVVRDLKASAERSVLKRNTTVEDVVNIVVLLSSDVTSSITGHHVGIGTLG